MTDDVTIEVAGGTLPGLWYCPEGSMAPLVLAHGAGAGMAHSFMEATARGLSERHIATLRFQFPFMLERSRRPDSPAVAQAAIRAAVASARALAPDLPLFAGGKSFGGRMTSQAQAADPLPGVRGLVFFGFPLHLAKKPAIARATHLGDVSVPVLFMQGTRDALADPALIGNVVERLGPSATFLKVQNADYAFHVPKDESAINCRSEKLAMPGCRRWHPCRVFQAAVVQLSICGFAVVGARR